MDSINREISIIIPVLNEAPNIKELVRRIRKSLIEEDFKFEIIFIDDHSTDGTIKAIQNEISNYPIELVGNKNKTKAFYFNEFPISFYQKKGQKGKAFSLKEGFLVAKYENIAVIDADLQYPPEAIAQMCLKLSDADIVVAERNYKKTTLKRKLISKSFRFLAGKLLFNLNNDIQSGLKVFRKEILQVVDFEPVSGWTFDLEFLHRAREAGFKIDNYTIDFFGRKRGKSKVKFVRTSTEIGLNALKVKFKKIEPKYYLPNKEKTMLGASIRHKKKHFVTHSTLEHISSALETITPIQKMFLISILLLSISGFVLNSLLTLQIIVAILTTIYFTDSIFNSILTIKSLRKSQEITFSNKEISSLKNKNLPVYTILCPLYKEAHMIPGFVNSINRIDWPKEKLDVMLLLEEDDKQSIQAARKLNLEKHIRVVVVPNSNPKTKPKACNYGLSLAKGEYLVIYDAEDIPDPLQLKKAYLGFKKAGKKILCLQAKLNYHNENQNLLTRFFTAEYSLWFDVTLTGYQSINTTIPLGGTSNHFKTKTLLELRGWDSFNVTEDADLGVRLFKKGYKTAIIDSTTLEEANSDIKNWIRQRSRWIKGYMQTYLVHTREHFQFFKKSKHHALLFNLILGGKIAFIFINPFLWLATISYFVLYQYVGPTIEKLYPPLIFYMAVFSLVFGNFFYLFNYMIGVMKREKYPLVKYIFFIPIYWLMISYAGFIALYQLIFKPFYWEKTLHGLSIKKKAELEPIDSVEVEKVRVPSYGGQPGLIYTFQSFLGQAVINIKFFFGDLGFLLTSKFDIKKNEGLSILIFNWRDTKHKWAGGAEKYVHELSKEWLENGNTVTLFCGNDQTNKRFEKVEGVNVIRLGGFYTVYLWAALIYLLKLRSKVDIIVDSENGVPFFTPIFSLKPIILLIHHIHQEVFTSELRFPASLIAKFTEGKLMPMVYKNAQVITVSESTKHTIVNLDLFKENQVEIVKPGISSMDLEIDKEENPTFIYLGRLKPYKNIDIAIKAFSIVEKYLPKAKMWIVGDGENRIDLETLSKNLKLEDKVQFFGKVSELEKNSLLSRSWIALQPSKIEGWGMTVIEANACKTPVIATFTDGLKDSIVDNSTGILVKQKDPMGFAKEMISLSRNDEKRSLMSVKAKVWSESFKWDDSSSIFLNILKKESEKRRYLFGIRRVEYFFSRITSLF